MLYLAYIQHMCHFTIFFKINFFLQVKTVFRRAKLLQFYDNQRPPYFGTWTKTSDKVNARKPFAMDSEYFDYDYDSDDDWEEEEQGKDDK